ncbi:hypothetical protein AAU61_17400 [Desulfocarbo indianensis]|nr:hypothetical protein AAU61_17400 [Desulfocarbo indianensis]
MSQFDQQNMPAGQESCAKGNEAGQSQGGQGQGQGGPAPEAQAAWGQAQSMAGPQAEGGYTAANQYQQQGPANMAPQGPVAGGNGGGGMEKASCGCGEAQPAQAMGGYGQPAMGQPAASFGGHQAPNAPQGGGWGAPQFPQPAQPGGWGGPQMGQPATNQPPHPGGPAGQVPGMGHVCNHDGAKAANMFGQFPGQGPGPMPGPFPGQGAGPMPGPFPGQGAGPMPGHFPGQGPSMNFGGHPGFGGMPFPNAQAPFQQAGQFGDLMGMFEDVINGKAEMSKMAGWLGSLDARFWKGAVMGAALALLISSPLVSETISGLFSGLTGKGDKEHANAPETGEEV